jgi:hypothetical protein
LQEMGPVPERYDFSVEPGQPPAQPFDRGTQLCPRRQLAMMLGVCTVTGALLFPL